MDVVVWLLDVDCTELELLEEAEDTEDEDDEEIPDELVLVVG